MYMYIYKHIYIYKYIYLLIIFIIIIIIIVFNTCLGARVLCEKEGSGDERGGGVKKTTWPKGLARKTAGAGGHVRVRPRRAGAAYPQFGTG